MRIEPLCILAATVIGLLCIADGARAASSTVSRADAVERCKALERTDFSKIPDAPTQVVKAQAADNRGVVASYCEVSGYVAPSVAFLLRLPLSDWNGKLVEIGCGAACGSTNHIVQCDDPLRRGYACVVSDGGHSSALLDVKWAQNDPQKVINYFVVASHVSVLTAKFIAQHYYDRAPRKSYFMGCSAGGIQAVWQAQKFPWNFDGIIAGAPGPSLPESWMNLLWGNRVLKDANGKRLLEQADLDLLHQAVVRKCDMNDGVRDGLIGDPRDCDWDPSELQCVAADKDGCLTPKQVDATKRIYGGPVTSDGKQVALPAAQRGSERTWSRWFDGSAANPNPMYNYIGEWFRYYFFQPNPGPKWELSDFDFDRDFMRFGIAEITSYSPDLRKFKSAGGKLIVYTGWNDAVDVVPRTLDYYESVERLMGGRAATQDFFRLFAVPGMNHCGGGDGASTIDWLSYLEAWVEDGQVPDMVIGANLKAHSVTGPLRFPLDPREIAFTRPVFPYPTTAKYIGSGDPKEAASFGPIEK